MISKIIHTADWHLGAPRVPQDVFSSALDSLVEVYRENFAMFVLCVGDVFDRAAPKQRTKDFLLDFLMANEDVNFVFTVGNHDYEDKNKSYHSLNYLSLLSNREKLSNVYVLEPGESIRLYNAITVTAKDSWESLHDPVHSKKTIYAYHGMPRDKVFLADDFSEELTRAVGAARKASGARYIALGDIHKRTFPYPGTLVQKTYSCEDGIILFDIDDKEYESIRLDVPKRVTIDLSDRKVTEKKIISKLKKVPEDSWVRVVTNLDTSQYLAIDKERVRKEVDKNFRELVYKNKPKALMLAREYPEEVNKAKTLNEICGFLIDDLDDVDTDRLKSLCSQYASKVE